AGVGRSAMTAPSRNRHRRHRTGPSPGQRAWLSAGTAQLSALKRISAACAGRRLHSPMYRPWSLSGVIRGAKLGRGTLARSSERVLKNVAPRNGVFNPGLTVTAIIGLPFGIAVAVSGIPEHRHATEPWRGQGRNAIRGREPAPSRGPIEPTRRT